MKPEAESEPVGPWVFVNSIISNKRDVLRDHPDWVSEYAKFMFIVGRALYHADTILLAQQVNQRPGISPEGHYRYLINSCEARSRYGQKWPKTEEQPMVALVAQYYGCSKRHARPMVGLHTENELAQIRAYFEEGGID